MTRPVEVQVDPQETFAAVPDGMQRLWTPHRMAYIQGEAKPADSSARQCPFCAAVTGPDAKHLVVRRSANAIVLCNLFPYNSGHLLVCPTRHVPDYTDVTDREREEIGTLTQQAMIVLRAAMRPDGFNLGMNQGETAGAGIAAHLHQHVVPRWSGDANFFPIVARTKAMPQLLEQTRQQLADLWDQAIQQWQAHERKEGSQ